MFASEGTFLKIDHLDDYINPGDGLLHEMINGLFEREDWATACQTPLGNNYHIYHLTEKQCFGSASFYADPDPRIRFRDN